MAIKKFAPKVLAAAFSLSGVLHLVRPHLYESLIPGWLPSPRGVVEISGVAELMCAVGLFAEAPWAGTASALLLAGIFPGNVQMLLNYDHAHRGLSVECLLLWVRLPIQVLLIWAALQANKNTRLRHAPSPKAQGISP